MKKSWNALLVLMLALPAYGQETPPDQPAPDAAAPADAAPADAAPADAAPADAAPADAAPADAAPADTGAVMNSIATDAAAESAPVEAASAPVEELPSEPRTPWRLYGGLDWVRNTLSSSQLNGFGAKDYDTGMYRARVGARLFDAIGAEVHFGTNRDEPGVPNATTDRYYGLFLVPTASLFETVELAFPVGYSQSKVSTRTAGASLNSISYGLNAALPLRVFSAGLPDVRFEAGWMIYYQKTNARIYGLNAGLRYDFEVNGFHMGNPFSGLSGMGDKIGGFFKGLWPFGKKDEPAEAAPAQ